WAGGAKSKAPKRNAVVGNEKPAGCLARGHNARGSIERGTLAVAEELRLRDVDTGIESKRQVHERDERGAEPECTGLGECSEGKPIENNGTAVRHRRQYRQSE